MGKRPDYATIVYSNLIRTWSKKPIILGGIEASLRRLAHYDYWSGKMKRSILLDSQADLISYGMGERSIVEIADALASGIEAKDITFIEGTVYKAENLDSVYDEIRLPSYREVSSDKKTYAESFYTQYSNTDPFSGKRLVEPYSDRLYVVQNPAAKPLTQEEMDDVYALPYMRTWHPCYDAAGGIPAITEVKFSLISNRGCFGGCSFCALTFHQGRIVQTRCQSFDNGCLTDAQTVPVPAAVQKHECRSQRLYFPVKEAAGDSEGKKSFHPFGYPFRLSAGGEKPGILEGALSVPCQRTAQGSAGTYIG